MSKFIIRETASGIKFDLKATNGQTILCSEVYGSRAACLKGIESIRRNAPKARIEDRTGENCVSLPHPKFEMYQDKAGAFRFRLKSANGRIIGFSEAYFARSGCLNGLESVILNAAGAEIEE